MGRPHSVTVEWTVNEPIGFAPQPTIEVVYAVTGSVRFGTRGNYWNPPDPDEVEIEEVVRIDPYNGTQEKIPEEQWLFDEAEQDKIEQALCDNATDEDDFPDPPDDDFDD